MKSLPTHEIGSMAKPSWRVKPFRSLPLTDSDIEEAGKWGERLDIQEGDQLIRLLAKRSNFEEQEKREILRFSSLYGTRLQEQAGLDMVWDGEQHRVEMYEYPIRRIQGFAFRGHVRSFDNKYYRKASCVGPLGLEKPYHDDEYQTISSFARKEVKIPLTGAYTLVDWSYDEHYLKHISPGEGDIKKMNQQARQDFLNEVAGQVIYPNLKSLADRGAGYLQIDEPAAGTKRDEVEAFIQATQASIGDLADKVFFSMHICFSDYRLLFPRLEVLADQVREMHLEYANRDSRELGVSAERRPGYQILEQFKNSSFVVGLGVLDVHTDYVEPPELVRDRILYACEAIGDPARIYVAPDCGLRTRSWEVTFNKLRNMVEGRDLAAQVLGID